LQLNIVQVYLSTKDIPAGFISIYQKNSDLYGRNGFNIIDQRKYCKGKEEEKCRNLL
jgi:hypothetical protein